MKINPSYLVCASLLAITACDKTEPAAAAPQAQSAALFTDSARTMVIVAHEDDDLGLLNPDLVHTIRAGKTVRAVMVTAGDANFPCPSENEYVKGRETGHLAAYAEMAQAAYDPQDPDAAWTNPAPIAIPGMPNMYYRLRTLIAQPQISVVHLSIPNDDQLVLEQLWNDNLGTLAFDTNEPDTRRLPSSYTRAKLISVLLYLMNDFQPTHISTLDSSKLWPLSYPWEHTDHLHTGLFAHAAEQRYTLPHTFRTYRTYNTMLSEPANVTPAEAAWKADVLGQVYGEWDAWFPNTSNNFCPSGEVTICGVTDVCQDPEVFWAGLESRQYTIAPVQGAGITGGIAGPYGKCLQASGTTAGSTINLQPCNMATANQQFKILTDGTIRQKSTDLCIAANGASALARPRNINLTLRSCAGTPLSEHKLMLMTNGQLRGVDATCVKANGSANGSALSIQECVDEEAQLAFRAQFSPAPFTAAGSAAGYADAQIPDNLAMYRSLDMADIDADGDADVCVRRSGGIYCSNYSAGTFSNATLRLASFTDAQGYSAAQYGSTVQLADINNDNRADVCGRRSDGIYCAHWTAGALGNYSRRSTSFVAGYSGIGSYASIRFVDVNGDNFADVCGRNANGIECGLNTGTGQFNAPTQWLSTEFTNLLGWDGDAYGGTMMFADIDGDGRTDVCGRGGEGIRCAIHSTTTNTFVDPHLWGASDDFDDAGGWFLFRHNYGSLRLADINGDGRADICGRSMWGLHCGISMGSSFGLSQKMIPINPYDNATGWDQDKYGATLMFGKLNADNHLDVCARGPIPGGGVGLRCAFAP